MSINQLVFLIALVFSLVTANVFSQDPNSVQSEETAQSEENAQSEVSAQQNENVETEESPSISNSEAIPEVFNPSEEIVEDTAVSFPVDI